MPPEKGNEEGHDAIQAQGVPHDGTPSVPPPPPIPSNDRILISQARTPPPPHAIPTDALSDLFKLPPVAALKLLCGGMESLVRVLGDIPPTPPPASPHIPNMTSMQKEKAAIVRSHSEKNLAKLHQQQQQQPPAPSHNPPDNDQSQGFFDTLHTQSIDGVYLRKTPSPPSSATPPQPYIVIGADSQPLNLQHSAITRKFFSKTPPPISIEDYLLRIHRFCPMSTAVYLATSFYIFRLAVDERAIPVTRRNCHRLLLAGLRVAMKALEDLSYPHSKMAKVGGVSEAELARLEISFCFLAGFELVVHEDTLLSHWEVLKHASTSTQGNFGDPVPNLKLAVKRKK
ncbi:cyclin-domain-containing protein [Xylariaceae sp. FL0594]|nr:cyclin-domain-containing protein [Xylariaceae sp. FL0594]